MSELTPDLVSSPVQEPRATVQPQVFYDSENGQTTQRPDHVGDFSVLINHGKSPEPEGYLFATFMEDLRTVRIQVISVDEQENRGKGYGTQLVRSAEGIAREIGASEIEGFIVPNPGNSRPFFEKMGYTITQDKRSGSMNYRVSKVLERR